MQIWQTEVIEETAAETEAAAAVQDSSMQLSTNTKSSLLQTSLVVQVEESVPRVCLYVSRQYFLC